MAMGESTESTESAVSAGNAVGGDTGIELDIVVMAAGRGTRMKSALPKVLHRLAGRSLLQHVLHTAARLGAKRIVTVTGHGAEQVEAHAGNGRALSEQAPALRFVRQVPQLGTGHAVQQAVPWLAGNDAGANGITLILNGDVPLIEAASARALVDACAGTRLALLTMELDDPSGYGRIVRAAADSGVDGSDGGPTGDAIRAIVEHKDATPEQRQAIREVYTGVMAAPTAQLKRWLARLTDHNAQREFYLTDVVAFAVADGVPVVSAQPTDESEVLGVNSAAQLALLERRWQLRQAHALMEGAGVRLADPARLDVRFDTADTTGASDGLLHCGSDVSIDVGCIFEGAVELADGVSVGAYCVIRNARIGAGAVIHPFTHIDGDALGVTVGTGARVGPYARLRPGAVLGEEVHVGNFVEVKNATLARGAKANHLAYLGDATVGERVNFGAGSITANYDGVDKHRTLIGDDAQVGSNCVLVAPVTVGAGATIGGGSTIGRDAPPGQLTVARARQVTLAGWKRPQKKK